MSEELVTVSARVRRSQAEEVERLATEKGVDKSEILRELLTMALQEQRIKDALEQVRTGKATVWKAAEVAGVTYREMLGLLRFNNIPFPLSKEEMIREIEEITRRQ
jgi:predicted HTH domain antitoxin